MRRSRQTLDEYATTGEAWNTAGSTFFELGLEQIAALGFTSVDEVEFSVDLSSTKSRDCD